MGTWVFSPCYLSNFHDRNKQRHSAFIKAFVSQLRTLTSDKTYLRSEGTFALLLQALCNSLSFCPRFTRISAQQTGADHKTSRSDKTDLIDGNVSPLSSEFPLTSLANRPAVTRLNDSSLFSFIAFISAHLFHRVKSFKKKPPKLSSRSLRSLLRPNHTSLSAGVAPSAGNSQTDRSTSCCQADGSNPSTSLLPRFSCQLTNL